MSYVARVRIPELTDLSFDMTNALPIKEALMAPDRARSVAISGKVPPSLFTFRRVMHLELEGVATLPPSIGKLRHLRAITVHGKRFTKVPAFVFALPKLKYLFLDGTGLTTLAGIETSKTLTDITFGGTPLAKQDTDELAEGIAGAKAMTFLAGLEFEREPAVPPKRALSKLLADDRLDDDANLTRADLRGGVFEDGLVTQNLTRANLAGTVWRRCDIASKLAGANLTDAVFEDCVFEGRCAMPSAKLAGAVFEHCAMISLDLTGADLTNARFQNLERCPHIDLTRARATGMQMAIAVLNSREIEVRGPKADLRGATIAFSLPTKAKARWKTGQFKGAKTDDATRLIYGS